MKRFLALFAATALLGGVAACGSDDADDAASPAVEEVTLTVYAAASLTATFTEIAEEFEAANEGVTVEFNFAGSSDLVAQIQQGAPADVFASADENNMTKATDDDLIDGEPELFATNTLTIAVPPGNPGGVETLEDLTDPSLNVVVCAPEVPCGAATQRVEADAGIDIPAVSEEQAVTDVLGKVASGEADAGLVYVTDVVNAGESVEGIDFPEAAAAVNQYPIGVVAGSPNAELAEEFLALVIGEIGQRILAAAGFVLP